MVLSRRQPAGFKLFTWCVDDDVRMGAVTNASLAAIIIKDNIELHKKINEQIEAGRKVINEQAAVVTDEIPGFGALSIAAFAAVVLQDEANLLKKIEEDKAEMRRVNVLFDESQANINTYELPDPKRKWREQLFSCVLCMTCENNQAPLFLHVFLTGECVCTVKPAGLKPSFLYLIHVLPGALFFVISFLYLPFARVLYTQK